MAESLVYVGFATLCYIFQRQFSFLNQSLTTMPGRFPTKHVPQSQYWRGCGLVGPASIGVLGDRGLKTPFASPSASSWRPLAQEASA
jgi:hypothetical protein